MQHEFTEIGRRLGPFDLTMIEVGAYDPLWPDVHIGPEQAIVAHAQVGGRAFLPLHWGTFDLALHGWTEPIERVLMAAAPANVRVLAPRPGEMIEPTQHMQHARPAPQASNVSHTPNAQPKRWWPDVPWFSALEVPLVSTGL